MSAKPKPAAKTPNFYYHFKLPDDTYIGRTSLHDTPGPQPVSRAIPYSARGITHNRADILLRFPTAKIVSAPGWNNPTHTIPDMN